MDERFECFGVRPKALVFRFYSDGSYEEFWELASGALRMDRTWRILNPTACPAYSSTSSDCRRHRPGPCPRGPWPLFQALPPISGGVADRRPG
jgi:hypothetical protein